jgi:hypothetical protein
MTCSEARTAIGALLDAELVPAEEEAVRGHLSSCAACARELEERRAFHETLAESMERAIDGVESTSEERERTAARMAAALRRRSALLPRLAAAVVLGIAVGLVAWSLARSAPTPDQLALVEKIREVRTREGQVELLRQDAGNSLRFVETALPAEASADPRLESVRVAVVSMQDPPPARPALDELVARTASPDPRVRAEAQRTLWRLGPESLDELRRAGDRAEKADRNLLMRIQESLKWRGRPEGAGTIAVVSRVVEGTPVTVTQWGDLRVKVQAGGVTIEAPNMGELLEKHADVCRRFSIGGGEGSVRVGESSAGVGLQDRFQLLLRRGGFDPDVLGEAYHAWMVQPGRDRKAGESRWRELEEKWRKAAEPVPLPPVPVDVDEILRSVKSLTRQQLEKTRAEVEARMTKLKDDLRKAHEFRAQAEMLRTYAEDARKEK